MKSSIHDRLLVTVIVALALGWFLDHQKHAKLREKLTKLAEENKKLQIQADLDATDRAVQSREFEQYKLKTLVESLKSQAPAPNPPKKWPMKYSLRSLMIVAILGPALLAGGISLFSKLADVHWPKPKMIIVLSGDELACMKFRISPELKK